MTKKYNCKYAESKGNIADDNGDGVYCNLTDKPCPCVSYEFPFGVELTRNMKNCPTYNASKNIARLIIKHLADVKKSELEKKVDK